MTLRAIEQLSEVAALGTPAYIVDPKTQAAFVLLSAEQYEKIRTLLGDDEFGVEDAYAVMDEVARIEGWDDPELDIYNQLRGPRT